LQALNDVWPQIKEMGAGLAAISPQDVAHTLKTKEELKLDYLLLADEGNKVAQGLGLAFAFNQAMKDAYLSFGTNLPEYNGDDSWVLPIPATYIVNPDRSVAWSFVEADYTKRAEPEEIVARLKGL
jgi:peroxiredoxin